MGGVPWQSKLVTSKQLFRAFCSNILAFHLNLKSVKRFANRHFLRIPNSWSYYFWSREDQFFVTNPGGPVPPVICGINTGEHSKTFNSTSKIPQKSKFFTSSKIVGPNPFAHSIGHHLESELFPYLLHFSRFYHSYMEFFFSVRWCCPILQQNRL